MKKDLVTIHQELGLIQVLNGLLTPALKDYYKALSINIKHVVGIFMSLWHYCIIV